MNGEDDLLASLAAAVSVQPGDRALRCHLAQLLIDAGRGPDAITHLAEVLAVDPTSAQAAALMRQALGLPPTIASAGRLADQKPSPPPTTRSDEDGPAGPDSFDWNRAEQEFPGTFPPPFVDETAGRADQLPAPRPIPSVKMADVGGMEAVKQRLELSFFGPMRHPELASAYGKGLRGGLLLYGPPGVGKTFIARAVAGEMGANFLHVGLADVLDSWLGAAEKNVRAVFDEARRTAPCVLFLDEIDALGQRRSKIGAGWSGLRGAVQQLLTEMDSVGSDNEGVYILAATNAPWDVDPALRRPGRLDRTVLVLPPDAPARHTILRSNLEHRPLSGVDLSALVASTEDFSGADLAHLATTAAEYALAEALAVGEMVPIGPKHLIRAKAEIVPSTTSWFSTARNAVLYGNESGEYDELLAYMRKHRLI